MCIRDSLYAGSVRHPHPPRMGSPAVQMIQGRATGGARPTRLLRERSDPMLSHSRTTLNACNHSTYCLRMQSYIETTNQNLACILCTSVSYTHLRAHETV